MSLQDFLVYDENIDQKVPLLLEDRRFYVYALLDPRKIGTRINRRFNIYYSSF